MAYRVIRVSPFPFLVDVMDLRPKKIEAGKIDRPRVERENVIDTREAGRRYMPTEQIKCDHEVIDARNKRIAKPPGFPPFIVRAVVHPYHLAPPHMPV